jgi:TolB protein
MKMSIRFFHGLRAMLAFVFALVFAVQAQAATLIDIYGPGQNQIKLALSSPLTGPEQEAKGLGADLHKEIDKNLTFLPFMNLVPSAAILGGTVLSGWQSEGIDFRRFQIAGADLVVTAYWPAGDSENSTVELRVFETFSGKFVFGNAYAGVTKQEVSNVADRFCDDLMYALTGGRGFFSSTVAFVKGDGKKRDVWLVRPTGRDLRQVTDLPGTALSPSWSPDGRYIVFSHRDDRTYALGVWNRLDNKVTRIRFPGNTVIGPCFLPDNRVAVSLSTGRYPDIFLLDRQFKRERALEQSSAINVSPSFDATGTKMAFTSNRLGGPQVFLKDLNTGTVTRVSKEGSYNSEPCISPDGTLIAYTKGTPQGFRIFVYDMVTGFDQQVSYGPGSDEQPAFAPDSYFVAFTSTRSGKQQIYLTTRHGGPARHMPTGAGNASFPRWGK